MEGVTPNGYTSRPPCASAHRKRCNFRPQPTRTDPDMSTGPAMDPATLEELRRLARSRPRSGRQSIAKASAIRTLERLAREGRRQPVPPMPEGWYPHEPGDPFYELDWVFLHEHPEILKRHWEAAWREGRV
jgi:hypothetical protein